MEKIQYMLRKRPIEIFFLIEKKGNLGIQRMLLKTGITYSHAVKVLKIMKQSNLVRLERDGRHLSISYTEKGLNVLNEFKGIKKLVSRNIR